MAAKSSAWMPGRESNPQLAISRIALRTDTECLAKIGPGVRN